jgi:hypothetical protein
MKYSITKLQELADADLIWPKKSSVYREVVKEELMRVIEAENLDEYLKDVGVDLVDEQLWWDVCGIVNDLAQLVLDEREKTNQIVKDLKRDLSDITSQLKKYVRK